LGDWGEAYPDEDLALLALACGVFDEAPLAVDAALCGRVQRPGNGWRQLIPHPQDGHACY
jgi:hypothetical protein